MRSEYVVAFLTFLVRIEYLHLNFNNATGSDINFDAEQNTEEAISIFFLCMVKVLCAEFFSVITYETPCIPKMAKTLIPIMDTSSFTCFLI